jgi:hypothetical protein
MERLETLKETLEIIKQEKQKLNTQRREALSIFIGSHIAEGWLRLSIEDYISYGEFMRGGSDYLVDESTFELFLSWLQEDRYMNSLEEARAWYLQYKDEPEQMASTLADFKDEVLEEGQGNFIDLNELP